MCCCPAAVNAIFCLWFRAGCSQSAVAGALTFFPPTPALYKFQRVTKEGEVLSEHEEDDIEDQDGEDSSGNEYEDESALAEQKATKEKKSPAAQLTERNLQLRKRAWWRLLQQRCHQHYLRIC